MHGKRPRMWEGGVYISIFVKDFYQGRHSGGENFVCTDKHSQDLMNTAGGWNSAAHVGGCKSLLTKLPFSIQSDKHAQTKHPTVCWHVFHEKERIQHLNNRTNRTCWLYVRRDWNLTELRWHQGTGALQCSAAGSSEGSWTFHSRAAVCVICMQR